MSYFAISSLSDICNHVTNWSCFENEELESSLSNSAGIKRTRDLVSHMEKLKQGLRSSNRLQHDKRSRRKIKDHSYLLVLLQPILQWRSLDVCCPADSIVECVLPVTKRLADSGITGVHQLVECIGFLHSALYVSPRDQRIQIPLHSVDTCWMF